ncbi:FUSC family protein [Streptomyces sp. ODS28]|uniref:FUSC family protein n=1 Tax=Streptomyces sp. ODS28 TaxID=3136688 RepID=UPI0031EDD8F2
MAWAVSLGHTVRKAFRTERTLADPWAIARAVLAVAAATAIGWASGDVLAATMMSVGAFICGIGTLLAPMRHRVVNALVMAVGFSAAAAVGVYMQRVGWYFLIVLAVAAFLAGLARALGAAPGIRACLVVIGMLITADVSPGVTAGLDMAGWIAAGAGLVVLAQLLPPYGRRHAAQRRTLAALYRALAAHARAAQGSGQAEPVSSAPFTLARRALALLPRFARPAAAPLYGLLGEAERIRRGLYASAGAAGVPRGALAEVLDAVAETVARGREHPAPQEAWEKLNAWQGSLAGDLLPRLTEAGRLAALAADRRAPEEAGPHQETAALYASKGAVTDWLRRLGEQLRPGAPLLRHALRVGIGTTVGEAAGRAIGDFWGHGLPAHGFWAALTTMLVLFPDYEHTFARGWARPVGSIAGGLVAWGLFQLHWGDGASAIAAVALAALVFATLRTGQHTLNLFLTTWLVFLLHRMGTEQGLVAWGRPADTLLGALIALVIFLLLPTWHHHRVPALLGRWLRAQRRLLPAVLTGYTEVGALDGAQLEALRGAARHAREELEEAVAKLPHEPRGHRARWSHAELARIQTSVFELTRCATQLVDRLPRDGAEVLPEMAEFAGLLDRHLEALAQAAEGGAPVRPGALRAEFDALAARTGLAWVSDPGSGEVSGVRARALTAGLRTVTVTERLGEELAGPVRGGGQRGRARHAAHASV